MAAKQPSTPVENTNKNDEFSVALAVIGTGLANVIALLQITSPFTLWNTMVGVIILFILGAYTPAPGSGRFLKLAYAAIWAISFLTAGGVVYNIVYAGLGGVFPDYTSKNFTPYFSSEAGKFTPFNAYDSIFFLLWMLVWALCSIYIFFLREKIKNMKNPPEPKTQPNATVQTAESVTAATTGQPPTHAS